jgi:HK97 family phage prohead protease
VGMYEDRAILAPLATREAGGKRYIVGVIPYDSPSQDLGGFTEKIRRGAFQDALSGDPTSLVWAHDSTFTLASTASGSLKLSDAPDGLHFEAALRNTAAMEDVFEMVGRDAPDCSFAFTTKKDSWDGGVRTLERVKLIEITCGLMKGAGAYPAAGATAALRARTLAESEEELRSSFGKPGSHVVASPGEEFLKGLKMGKTDSRTTPQDWKSVAKLIRDQRAFSFDLNKLEARAVTANGAGARSAPGVLAAFIDGGKMGSLVEVFSGEASSLSVVSTFTASPAAPSAVAPGSTGIAADSSGVLIGKNLTLSAYVINLPVARGALLSQDFEERLPDILRASLGGAVDRAVLTEDGTGVNSLGVNVASANGVPTAQDIACAASGFPKIADLLGLAESILAGSIEGPGTCIAMHPLVYLNILKDTTSGYDQYKNGLQRREIVGVPIVLSTYLPAISTAGTYMAVGGNFKHYGLAMSPEIAFDYIESVGSDNVNVTASLYMRGSPMIGGSFWRLKAV